MLTTLVPGVQMSLVETCVALNAYLILGPISRPAPTEAFFSFSLGERRSHEALSVSSFFFLLTLFWCFFFFFLAFYKVYSVRLLRKFCSLLPQDHFLLNWHWRLFSLDTCMATVGTSKSYLCMSAPSARFSFYLLCKFSSRAVSTNMSLLLCYNSNLERDAAGLP